MNRGLKRLIALVLLTVSAGHVQGQSWDTDNGTITFLGCGVKQEQGTIECHYIFNLTREPTAQFVLPYNSATAYTAEGFQVAVSEFSLAGGPFRSFNITTSGPQVATVLQNIPVRAAFRVPLPLNTTFIRALVVSGHRLDNVPVSGTSPAPSVGTVPPTTLTAAGFSIKFSNCKSNSGVYTCTATLVHAP